MITYVTYKLTKKEYDYLYQQGGQAIIWYGWELVSSKKDPECEEWYKGSYLHADKKNNDYEIVCKIDTELKSKYEEE